MRVTQAEIVIAKVFQAVILASRPANQKNVVTARPARIGTASHLLLTTVAMCEIKKKVIRETFPN